jgi:D-tyrosyl-tRNA(Tyr) deacylase
VGHEVVGSIDRGFLVLLGVADGDTSDDAEYLAQKVVELRVFEDSAGKMNLALGDVAGSVLAISQFTLLADCRKGRRPSFSHAAPPEAAEPLFDRFVEAVRKRGIPIQTGRFGAHMEVELVNDGPVTLLLDSTRAAST